MVTKLQISCAAPVGVCGHAAAELRRFSRGVKTIPASNQIFTW